MQRIKLTISYLGTNYHGWQYQDNANTLQKEVESAIEKLFGQFCRVTGAGRTDEGVHALNYPLHFDAPKNIPLSKIVLGLNRFLPQDISAVSAQRVGDDFDARKSAKSKTYLYRFYIDSARQPFLDQTHLQLYKQPDVEKMKRGGALFCGTHDFSAFARQGSNILGSVRTIYSLDICQEENILEITVKGNAFLYNMVRNIAGTLLWLGQGKLQTEDIETMLSLKKRIKYFKTLPGKGLTFVQADY